MNQIICELLVILLLPVLIAFCDEKRTSNSDLCSKNFSWNTPWAWEKCNGSFTSSEINKLKANVKPIINVSKNPFEGNDDYDNTNWCLGPYLQLLDPPGPFTGLWSVPGSGNYWLRYLIQQATGYMTGTMYPEHNKRGFPGGHIANGSVLAVKDHFLYIVHGNTTYQKKIDINLFDRAILLIRDPLDTFIAEVNRHKTGSNTENLSDRGWLDMNELVVYDYYENQIFPYWKKFHQKILDEYEKELLLVEYENLKADLIGELTKVVTFLGLPLTENIKECIRKSPDGLYKRPKPKQSLKDLLIKSGKLQRGHVKLSKQTYKQMVKRIKKSKATKVCMQMST